MHGLLHPRCIKLTEENVKKMKTYYLLLCSFLLTGSLSGQQTGNVIPLYEYKFSREIDEGLSTGEMRIVKAAQYYSCIGEYQKATKGVI
jgi:hypothetical protein